MIELNRSNQQTEPKTGRLRWLVAIAASVTFIVIWLLVPPLVYQETAAKPDVELTAIAGTRTALLTALVGLGALLVFWEAGRMRRLTEQGQITDRYAKAVEQLGSEKLDVRLGGIYALERISRDSRKDQATIVEVLSAFVRVHSERLYRLRSHDADRKARGLASAGYPGRVGGSPQEEEPLEQERHRAELHVVEYPLPEDVKAAVTVLGRLNISQADLKGAYLASVDLKSAILKGAHLEGAILKGAHLEKAILEGAHLEKAKLTDAEPQAADLSGAHLEGANLKGAHLEDAILKGAHLDGADLGAADLSRANLEGAFLCSAEGLTVEQVKLARCYLSATLPDNIKQQLEHPSSAPFEDL